ncbi:MAG: hypothetical protein IJV00_11005 [Clostridia bacterium]|nr:hypothetical protein [Clostridia bacterium]
MLLFEDGERIAFLGDSVCWANKSDALPLGDGYVRLTDAFLRAFCPERRIGVANLGRPQNIASLLGSLGEEGPIESDHAVLLIGNDEISGAFREGLTPDAGLFGDRLRALADLILPSVKNLFLMTPFCLYPHEDDPLRESTDEFRREVTDVASEYMLTCVDLQAEFDRYLLHRHALTVSSDGFTPRFHGHLIIAHAFLREAGFTADSDSPQPLTF